MSLLSQAFESFLRHAPDAEKRCFMLVYPNPRLWLGLRELSRPSHRELSYVIAFGRGRDEVMAAGQNAWGITYANNYSYWQSLQDKLQFSEWSQVSAGEGLRDSLLKLLDTFPELDISTREGREAAAKAMDEYLKPTARDIVRPDNDLLRLGRKVNLRART